MQNQPQLRTPDPEPSSPIDKPFFPVNTTEHGPTTQSEQRLLCQPGLSEHGHSHEGRRGPTLLRDVIQDDVGVLHLLPLALPLGHIAFQTEDH